jgi:hypothetical protein
VRTRMSLIAGVAVLALAAGLFAQEAPKRWPMAWGKVVSLDKEAKTLTIEGHMKRGDEAQTLVFTLTDTTKVMVTGGEGAASRAGTLDDVKTDARVSIMYKAAEGDANPVALSIVITAASATK